MSSSYVITGALAGIGEALARRLAGPSVRLCVNDAAVDVAGAPAPDRAAEAERLVEELTAAGAEVRWTPGSVADPETAEQLFRDALDGDTRLAGVVNCAGILGPRGLIDAPEETWRLVVATHLTGSFHISRAFGRAARAGQPATLVLVTSAAGLRPVAGVGPYGVAKAGVAALAQSVADETGKYGARAYAVSPWAVTRLAAHINAVDPTRRERLRALTADRDVPLPRALPVEPVAEAIVALLHHPAQLAAIIESAGNELAGYVRTSPLTFSFAKGAAPADIAAGLNRMVARPPRGESGR